MLYKNKPQCNPKIEERLAPKGASIDFSSVAYHFYEHGEEVGATDISQYLRKADGFKANLRGAHKSYIEGYVDGVIRYSKNGKYIDLAPDGSIISFGKQ